jgi:hypothetical protein
LQTHLRHVSKSSEHSRDQDNVCDGDPRCALRPAEVLVAVDHHVCCVVSSPCIFLAALPLLLPLRPNASFVGATFWVRRFGARGARRTVPFYDRRIALEDFGVVVTAGHFKGIGVIFGAVEACWLACR